MGQRGECEFNYGSIGNFLTVYRNSVKLSEDMIVHGVHLFQEISKRHQHHIPAPKLPLPGHSESYNPPPEYLFSEEEVSFQ